MRSQALTEKVVASLWKRPKEHDCSIGGRRLAFETLENRLLLSGPSDTFEDGSIDTGLWDYGGRRFSWTPSDQGSWTWSHDEVIASDGYLENEVNGPLSANSYGAVAWTRSEYDFNDGMSHVLDFAWQADVSDSHHNMYFIQITDGYIPTFSEAPGGFYDVGSQVPAYSEGTTDFLWRDTTTGESPGKPYSSDSAKETCSLVMDPSGIGSLYDGPNGTGTLVREELLHTGKAWHVRFMVADATSAGFFAGPTRLKLYSFESEPPGTHLETLEVPAQGTPVVMTSLPSEVGQRYLIEASGTYIIDSYWGRHADAEWVDSIPSGNWVEPRPSDHYDDGGDLIINGQFVDWEGTTDGVTFTPHEFSSNHVYRCEIDGTGDPLAFQIADWDHSGDNSGSLQVKIYDLGSGGQLLPQHGRLAFHSYDEYNSPNPDTGGAITIWDFALRATTLSPNRRLQMKSATR